MSTENTESVDPTQTEATEEEQAMQSGAHPERLRKLAELREQNADPFAFERWDRDLTLAQIRAEGEARVGEKATIGGRAHSLRRPFLGLADESGDGQVYLGDLSEEAFTKVYEYVDLGDIVGATGTIFQTQKGDWAIRAERVEILAKALRQPPFPKVYYKNGQRTVKGGLRDTNLRYRQRYVDLFVNANARKTLIARSKIVKATREYLDSVGYLEVETPVLVTEATGASARPFNTFHNAEKLDMHLRISLELPLKRLIVGGIEKVYEIGRVFRNEGIDQNHNPEFTLLEFYEAFTNLEGVMDRVEALFLHICRATTGGDTLTLLDGTVLDFGKPWNRLPMLAGIAANSDGRITEDELHRVLRESDLVGAKEILSRVGGDTSREFSVGGIVEKLTELLVEPTMIQPTFLTDFPYETSPLARKKPGEPHLTRRFEIYIAGAETGNAFSEINDPIDQKERFEFQAKQAAAGDAEAHPYDADYIRALEYGMPPTGGFGMGIDRVVMLFTGAPSIRDVLFFPLMRPEGRS